MILSTAFPKLDTPRTPSTSHAPVDVPYQLYTPYHTEKLYDGSTPSLVSVRVMADEVFHDKILDQPTPSQHARMVARVIAYFDLDEDMLLTSMPHHPMVAPNTVLVTFTSEDHRALSDSWRMITTDNAETMYALMNLVKGKITLPTEALPRTWLIEDAFDDPDNPPARVSIKHLNIPAEYRYVALYATTTQRQDEYDWIPQAQAAMEPITHEDIIAYAADQQCDDHV